MSTDETATLHDEMRRIEAALEAFERLTDAATGDRARELVQALLHLHRAGLERMLAVISRAGDPDRAIVAEMARDELVGSLLALHGLHPVDAATRVRAALDGMRPYLHAHGGDVELLAVSDSAAQVRLHSNGCCSSVGRLRNELEDALVGAAPDVTTIEIQEPETPGGDGPPRPGWIPLPVIHQP